MFCENADMTLVTYIAQLDAECAQAGLDLAEVCRADGLADTTLARWRKGEAHCRHDTAQSLFRRIRAMAVARSAPQQAA